MATSNSSDPKRATLVEGAQTLVDRLWPKAKTFSNLNDPLEDNDRWRAVAMLTRMGAALDADAREITALRQQLQRGERIITPCPSCGSTTLFVSPSGHLTCSLIGCAEPVVERAIAAKLQAERTRAEQAETWQAETCAWEEDDDTTSYTTACGQHWQFSEGGTVENGARYCYHCGRRIQLQPAER